MNYEVMFNELHTQVTYNKELIEKSGTIINDTSVNGIPVELKIDTLQNLLKKELINKHKEKENLQSKNNYDKNEQLFIIENAINYLECLQQISLISMIDYKLVDWAYNDGFLRSSDELLEKTDELKSENENLRQKIIRSSEQFQKGYHPFLVSLIGIFGIPILIGILWEGFPYGFLEGLFLFGMIFPLWIGLAALITWFYCKHHAKKFDISISELEKEAIIGATVTAVIKNHHDRKVVERELASKSNQV